MAAAAAALPAAAQAGPRFDYRQVFTTDKPGKSTGIDTQILYKHPNDPNAKPPAVREEVFTFPIGTTFDETVVPNCTLTDTELQLMGESGCPKETWVGSGHNNTSMTGFPGAGETPIVNNAFDYGGGEFRIVGGPRDNPQIRAVAHGKRVGRVSTVTIPAMPGGPPDGQNALRRIRNIFPARSSGRRAYVRTPKRCPSTSVWTFKARLTFSDGGVERNVHRMPCRRKPKRG
jgi:hypothetical protein